MTAEAFRAQIEALDARFPLTGNSTLTGNSKRQRTARNVTPQARGSIVISTHPQALGCVAPRPARRSRIRRTRQWQWQWVRQLAS